MARVTSAVFLFLGAGPANAVITAQQELSLLSAWQEAHGAIDCGEYPGVCEAPFNCNQLLNTSDLEKMMWQVADEEGHANMRSWCMAGGSTYWSSTVQECLVNKNLKESAKLNFDIQRARGADEEDASFCFLEKHCTNTDVTESTSPAEAESICDQRYGKWWRHFGLKTAIPGLAKGTNTDVESYKSPALKLGNRGASKLSMRRAMLSCAMGSYHCDVVYCKETYCKDPAYVGKYSKYLKAGQWTPNHLKKRADATAATAK